MIVENPKAIVFTILGQAQSKANSRKVVDIPKRDAHGERVMNEDGSAAKRRIFAKSAEAMQFEKDALRQIPPWARQRLEGDLRVTLKMFYRTRLPDLDESIVLDILQDRWWGKGDGKKLVQNGVYRNDRQVWEKHVYKQIDPRNPRVEVCVEALQAQQGDLLIPAMSAMDAKELPPMPAKRDPDEVPF